MVAGADITFSDQTSLLNQFRGAARWSQAAMNSHGSSYLVQYMIADACDEASTYAAVFLKRCRELDLVSLSL